MRHPKATLTALLAVGILALLAPAAFAGDTTIEGTHFKISTSDAGTVEFDLDELAVGESRHFTTDQDKPVDVTRTEAGYELTVDGKKLDVILDGEETASVRVKSAAEGGDGEREVMILRKRAGDGSGEPEVVVMTEGDGGEGGKRMIRKRIITSDGEEDGEVRVKVLGDGEDIDLEGLEVGEDGDGHVVVIKKRVHGAEAGENEGEPRRIEIRVEKKVKQITDEDDDR